MCYLLKWLWPERGGGGLKGVVYIYIFIYRERERETYGQAQFDWMLDGGSLKAQQMGSGAN
jgi:hypothetical protein